MKKIRIAGVPEHFNHPWTKAIAENKFSDKGINLKWTAVAEGTGRLNEMLRDGTADMAIILTEGILKDILAGNPSKIVQIYVESPLIWGIHVHSDSPFETPNALQHKKVAISRLGSGSELMARVHAHQMGWDNDRMQFEIINTIDGAVEALKNKTADYFMWEQFMTKPLVDKGIFRRIGVCPTPWPSFVIAVRDEVLAEDSVTIKTILEIINECTKTFKEEDNISSVLSATFGQKENDIQEWMKLTSWSQSPLDEAMLNNIQNELLELGIITKKGTFVEIVKAL